MRSKRKNSDEDEGSEMDVDDEQKQVEINEAALDDEEEDENEDMSDDEEEIDEPAQAKRTTETPFLDSFYGLSSAEPKERAQAAQVMLHHCLLGPSANSKDASYAFRRLLNGLCSGRAAARQGNGSALTSFLRISFQLEKMEEIRAESQKEESELGSLLAYVRERLLKATDPTQTTGKIKGSEERDYQFGRLFGILAVVRSGILLPSEDGDHELADIIKVTSGFVSDITELFWLKKWMREPAAHGITTLLNSFYSAGNITECKQVVESILREVVLPKILLVDGTGNEPESMQFPSLLASYSAEQIAIAATIQSHIDFHENDLPAPLDKPVLSTVSMPLIAQALCETSIVVQPRTHFVWDAIWSFLTKNEESEGSSSSQKQQPELRLRQRCPVGDESALDVLDALISLVVEDTLLRIEKEGSGHAVKTTHDRRSLSLCIVKNLCGVTFVSRVSGPIQIKLEPGVLETIVLRPGLVRALFLDVICAGNQKKQTTHLLKPLALEILQSITEALSPQPSDEESSRSDGKRRLACVRAFLNCEIRFDARTKTSTVADLLLFGQVSASAINKAQLLEWTEYVAYLEQVMITKSAAISVGESATEATGYVELLYSTAKSILRLDANNKVENLPEFKASALRRIHNLFMASAFFDCSSVSVAGEKKKKKGKKGNTTPSHPVLEAASKLKGSSMPYSVRTVISARFFSLVAEHVNYATHHLDEGEHESKQVKDSRILEILSEMCESWKVLESAGAERFKPSSVKDDGDDEADPAKNSANPEEMVTECQKRAQDLAISVDVTSGDSVIESRKRCATGAAVLTLTLHLHRLSCGIPDEMLDNDDPDADDEHDEEEIINAMEELQNITEDFLADERNEDANPLLGLAESCANILSSPLGSGNSSGGASPKLVREAVKFAWLGGLTAAAAISTDVHSLLDTDVVNILLEAIGASGDAPIKQDDEEDGEDDDEDEDDSEASEDEAVFSKASGVLDEEDMNVDKPKDNEEGDDSDSDVALDSSKLQSMLEEDSDTGIDAGVLEHHEGADAALANLIKMKQEARKAGQQAREKLEISNQLRCTFLLELMIGRPEGWSRLFRSDIILKMLMPMVNHRKAIEKSLKKATEKAANIGMGEKKALLDKLTSLLKSKLCKMRLASTPCSQSVDIVEYAANLVSQLIEAAKKEGTKEHAACCSNGLTMVLRAIPDAEGKLSVAALYGDVVLEWSSKRTTRIDASLFDELITHMPR
jgi:hypothetical protein